VSGLGRELRFRAASVLAHGFVGSLFLTIRIRREGRENYLRFREAGKPVILVFWHGQILSLLYGHRPEGAVALVSDHDDGEYVARLLRRLGFFTVRGSSTRGATKGLRALIRAAREGRDLALSPDGPRGPAHVLKPGALLAARLTGLPIVPVAAGASAFWKLRSWDGFMIPRPFSRVELCYAPPHWIDADATEEDLQEHARQIERTLNELTSRVQGRGAVASHVHGTAPR